MVGLKRISTNIVHKVENGPYCNKYIYGTAAPDIENTCRFVIRNNQNGFTCALYNVLLTDQATHIQHSTRHIRNMNRGRVINKCPQCLKALQRGEDVVDDDLLASHLPSAAPSPREVIKQTIKDFKALTRQLMAQGYPAEMAERFAEQALTK